MAHLTAAGRKESGVGHRLKASIHCDAGTFRRSIEQQPLGRAEVLDFFRAQPPCLVGIEACGTAHHWAREIRALGHEVRLIPAAYVKPYVKRGKTDAADAEAICEAVTRPTMRFVPVKTAEQQAVLMLHRTRCTEPGTCWFDSAQHS